MSISYASANSLIKHISLDRFKDPHHATSLFLIILLGTLLQRYSKPTRLVSFKHFTPFKVGLWPSYSFGVGYSGSQKYFLPERQYL